MQFLRQPGDSRLAVVSETEMKLADYLKENSITAASFAEMIGVDKSTVCRWIEPAGDKVYRPRWDHIRKIEEITGGLVKANDFADPPIHSAA